MKQLLITIAAVVLVGCGTRQQSVLPAQPRFLRDLKQENIEAVKQHLAAGLDANAAYEYEYGEWIPLHEAAVYGPKEMVELLIANGADVNAKGRVGNTALHLAANQNKEDIFELLIANGADVNAKNKFNETPLDFAVAKTNNLKIPDLLRKHGGKTGEELKAEGK